MFSILFCIVLLYLAWHYRVGLWAWFKAPPRDPLQEAEDAFVAVASGAVFGKRAVPPASPAGQDAKAAGPTGA